MKLFFDTSALIKAFHREQGSEIVIKLLSQSNATIKLNYKSIYANRYRKNTL